MIELTKEQVMIQINKFKKDLDEAYSSNSNENVKEYTSPVIDIPLEEYNNIIYNISVLSNKALKPLELCCEYYTKPVEKFVEI